MLPESFLKHTRDGPADSSEHGTWPRNCADAIDDLVRLRIDEHLEELFAALRVVRQRSVGEAKSSDIIRAADTVDNTATVQRPEPEVANQNGDDGSTASTATRLPVARYAETSAEVDVDLPTPGEPVIPTMCA